MKNLNQLAKEAHENAKNKGFYDKPLETGTLLMLIVSELGEAMEADRKGYKPNKNQFEKQLKARGKNNFKSVFEIWIKDCFEDELADAMIRILDLCAFKGVDIQWHVEQKMEYNKTRDKLHGKKY